MFFKNRIRAYLNPNPKVGKVTLTNCWGDRFVLYNEPYLEIELSCFPRGDYSINIKSPINDLIKFNIDSRNTSVFIKNPAFKNHTISIVTLDINGPSGTATYDLPLTTYKIYGHVRDFNEEPFPAYLWATNQKQTTHDIVAASDNRGYFEFYYPTGKPLRLFVDDETYGKTTSECWINSNNITSDIEVFPHVGSLELYGFNVWESSGIWHIFFLPSLISSPQEPPEILASNVKVWINKIPGKIMSFNKTDEYLGDNIRYPGYLTL